MTFRQIKRRLERGTCPTELAPLVTYYRDLLDMLIAEYEPEAKP